VTSVALELLREYAPSRPVRLLGARVAGLAPPLRTHPPATRAVRAPMRPARAPRPTTSWPFPCSVPPMPVAVVGDVQVSYERAGSGPPLLLIMGMSGSRLTWGKPFLDELRRDFDVIAYDNRGVGDSSWMREQFTIGELAGDAAALLDALELESVHVAGISMGGMIAQELVLNHPERVRTLALGCTYCGGPGTALTAEPVVQRLTAAIMSGDHARSLRTSWEVNVSPAFAAESDSYASFTEAALKVPVAVPVIMAQMRAIAQHDTSGRLRGLQVPTLVVHGTVDEMLPVENARVIAGLIPDSRLELMDGVGHLFFWEQPARAAGLLREHVTAGAQARR
jgi:3-oxoadipate enol-lactonase